MTEITNSRKRLTIRIGRSSLSFSATTAESQDILFEPFVVKSGVSMAANLREAFKTTDMLFNGQPRVSLLIDSDVLMVPVEQFDEKTYATLYNYTFPRKEHDQLYYNVLPDLNAVAVFPMNKDLRTVLDDHFSDVRVISTLTPVWRHLHQRSYTGKHEKLFGYFHENRLEVFSFRQNRFRFCNSFAAQRPNDALYFLLYVWQQLRLQADHDELHIVGDIPEQDWLLEQLGQYLRKAYVINPSADFNRHPATQIRGMAYDLMTYYVKGR